MARFALISDVSDSEVLYLQPYPDRMLPEDPQESVVAIELAFRSLELRPGA